MLEASNIFRAFGRAFRGSVGVMSVGVGVCVLAGCQLIVSGDIPSFQCEEGANTSCPEGFSCVRKSCVPCADGVCQGTNVTDADTLPDSSASPDATLSGDSGASADATLPDAGRPDSTMADSATPDAGGTDGVDTGCTGAGCAPSCDAGDPSCAADNQKLGDPCAADSECRGGFCLRGTDINTTNANKFCSKACCTSQDCAKSGFVCFGSGRGGYCVPEGDIQRTSSLSGSRAGAACTTNEDCRSGSCGTDKVCHDTCCVESDCSGGGDAGATCGLHTLSNHPIFGCIARPTLLNEGKTCTVDEDCKSGDCHDFGFIGVNHIGKACTPTCCSTQCAVSGSPLICVGRDGGGGDIVHVCEGIPSVLGTNAAGSTCVRDSDCQSGLCDLIGNGLICAETCCTDRNCTNGNVCRPSAGPGPMHLHCIPGP